MDVNINIECVYNIYIYIYWSGSLFISATRFVSSLSANPTKWSNTLKQFVGKLPTNCLSVFDHFWKLVLKELRY